MNVIQGFDVHIETDFRIGLRVYFFRRNSQGTITHMLNTTDWTVHPFEDVPRMRSEMDEQAPLVIDERTASRLIEQLKAHGIKAPEQSLLAGQLEKQTEHLKDLQNMLRTKGLLT